MSADHGRSAQPGYPPRSVLGVASADELAGRKLYGEDLTRAEIAEWLGDEAEGYASLAQMDRPGNGYGYHALNEFHGFRWLARVPRFSHVLSLGGAFGEEVVPLAEKIDALTIVEPSADLRSSAISNIRPRYVSPTPSGELPFSADSFDLVTSFGTLHHVPRVRTTILEIARCLVPGGYAVIREPTVSLGDWTRPRRNLTKHERGLPLRLFRQYLSEAELMIIKESYCMFSLTRHTAKLFAKGPFNVGQVVRIDAILARAFSRRLVYHAETRLQKLRPTSIFYVLQKPGTRE